ncbi:unnamed protein product [Mytilus coruscus]|uniref:Uncharacterized protein n=1 Tax=Mytilus coruscus TaxID=42192 RepID=A0A6J8AAF7_MYTCO|nr:unnamed protein product [Mytilus coruscus]
MQYFGPEKKTTSMKDGAVVKIVCDFENDKNCSIKVSFYKTGSVVKQGSECVKFSDTFFQKLRDSIPDSSLPFHANDSLDENMNPVDHENKTVIEQKEKEENSLDSSVTFTKNLITNDCTSTPIQKQVPYKHDVQSPKKRITQHSKTLCVKLDAVNTTFSQLKPPCNHLCT